MSTPTLDDLLQPKTRETIEAMLLASLQSEPIDGMPGTYFPVTDWIVGSFERTMIKMVATGMVDREQLVRYVTAGGFLDLAIELEDDDGNPVEGWAELLAKYLYDRIRQEATYTKQVLTLTCTAGPGPYAFEAGDLVARSPSTGNTYRNLEAGTIPDGGSVQALFVSESPGAVYRDAANSVIELVTPLPGVSVNNAATAASTPASYLTGTGAIAVTSSTITTDQRTLKITITAPGRIDDGTAQFTCTVYRGTAITTSAPAVMGDTYTSGDCTLGFTDGDADTNSFNTGDTWIVGLPGTPLVAAGADKEQLTALVQRCRDRWPELSEVPTGNRFAGQVRTANQQQSLGVTKVYTAPSTTVAGVENVYVAGPTATATPAQVAALQAYLDARSSQIDRGVVIAATAWPISLGGWVRCRRGQTAKVKKEADRLWAAYIADLPLGGEQPEGIVKLLALQNAINDAGAENAGSLTLNGLAADNILEPYYCVTVAEADGLPSTGLTWKEVA